ncbi:MAG: prolyl oligopeptidase family serine peptidase [Anaerolineae bacterium]|nr:prolyl oligopeptidase family serine peptidase [Anaerolineae bacterium]
MRLRRWMIALAILIVLLLIVGYAGASYVIYNRLTAVTAGCSAAEDRDNTPAAFDTPDVDTAPYLMPDYEEVRFPSRDDGLTIDGWYVPGPSDTGRLSGNTVILVHGLGRCKRSPSILLPAGMLYRAGYNTLLIDLRDHGDSQVEDGRYAGGTEEYRDVLGAWDWLVNERSIPPERIGLFGTSLGAATVLIAFGEEPRVAAVWEDSSFADIQSAVDAELTRFGLPTVLAPGGLLIGKLVAGDDITAYSPQAGVAKANGRPIFITHGTDDTRLSVAYADVLAETARAHGDEPEVWIIDGSEHVRGMFEHTDEYESKLTAFFDAALSG